MTATPGVLPADNILVSGDRCQTTGVSVSTADAFWDRFVRNAPAEAIDTDPVAPGLQPFAGTEEHCLEAFHCLPTTERIKLLDRLNDQRNHLFLVSAYRFSTVDEALARIDALKDKASRCSTPQEAAQLRESVSEELAAQRAVLAPLRSRMAAGLYVSKEDERRYTMLRQSWLGLYRAAPFLFDTDTDGAPDARWKREVGSVDAFPHYIHFTADVDHDGIPDTLSATGTSSAPMAAGKNRPYEVTVDGSGDTKVSTLSITILLKRDPHAPASLDLEALKKRLQGEVQRIFDGAVPAELQGKVRIRTTFTTDENALHHVTVQIQEKGQAVTTATNTPTHWFNTINPLTAAHEIGHLFGWIDKYHRDPAPDRDFDNDQTFSPGDASGIPANDLMLDESPGPVIAPEDLRLTIALAASDFLDLAQGSSLISSLFSIEYVSAELNTSELTKSLVQGFEDVQKLDAILARFSSQAKLQPEERAVLTRRAEGAFAILRRATIKHALRTASTSSRAAAIAELRAQQQRIEAMRGSTSLIRQKTIAESLEELQRLIKALKQGDLPASTDAMHAIQTLSNAGLCATTTEFETAIEELKRDYRDRFTDHPELEIRSLQLAGAGDPEGMKGPLPSLRLTVRSTPRNGDPAVELSIEAPLPFFNETPQQYAKKLFKLLRSAQADKSQRRQLQISIGGGVEYGTQGPGFIAGASIGGQVAPWLNLNVAPQLRLPATGEVSAHLLFGVSSPINDRFDLGAGAGPALRWNRTGENNPAPNHAPIISPGGTAAIQGTYHPAPRLSLSLFFAGDLWHHEDGSTQHQENKVIRSGLMVSGNF